MTLSKGAANRFSPVRGWVTEGNLAQYPQDVAVDIENMAIDKRGLTERRLGMDAASATKALPSFTDEIVTTGAFNVKQWSGLGTDKTRSVLVVHSGDFIYILDDSPPITEAKVLLTVDTSASSIRVNGNITTPMHISIGADFSVVTNIRNNPVVLIYEGENSGTGELEFDWRRLDLEIRARSQLFGQWDLQDRWTGQSVEQLFDMRNSGWLEPITASSTNTGSGIVEDVDPVAYFEEKLGYYPKPSYLFSAMKISTATAPEAIGTFSPWEAEKIQFGNTQPPYGHYIHSAYYFSTLDLLGGGVNDTSWTILDRPESSAYHNGHVFFGDKDEEGKTRILVSRIVDDIFDIEKCYQDADPTAEEINDLVATDGFVLKPAGMGTILNMVEFNRSLLVMCTNGVWQLRATAGGGVTATDVTIDKVGAFEFFSPHSVVNTGNAILMFTDRGIIAVSVNQFGELEASNLTEDTIDEFYEGLSRSVIANVKGTYITDERRIYWTIPSPVQTGTPCCAELVLVMNLDTGGFYKYTVEGGPQLLVPVQLSASLTEVDAIPITETDGTVITTIAGDPVTTKQVSTVTETTFIGFLTSYTAVSTNTEAVFTSPINRSMYDWTTLGAQTSYQSFVDFSYEYPSSMIGGIQAPYVHSFFLSQSRTLALSDKSSAKMSVIFDWTLDARTKKISREQEAFKYDTRRLAQANGDEDDYPYEVVDTKLRVRGAGRSMRIRYRSEEGKDLRLLGYALLGLSLNDTEGNK